MKITYCTNLRLPTERVHGHQVAEVCRALCTLGHDVSVVAPYRKESGGKNFTTYYHLPSDIHLTHLGETDPLDWKWLPEFFGFILLNYRFKSLLSYFLRSRQTDALYTRSPVLLPALLESKLPVLLELHSIPNSSDFIALAQRCTLVIALTTPMREELIQRGLDASRVIVAGDAVNLSQFGQLPDRSLSRKKYSIDDAAFVVGYAGQLESMGLSKGIPELLSALEKVPDARGLIAGGPDASKKTFEASLSPDLRARVTFTGVLPHEEVSGILVASDVLVYPAPKSDHPFYNRDTSPVKIFEYMASGIPIISADLPPVRDILDPSVALLVPPGNADALTAAIEEIKNNPEAAKKRAEAAQKRVSQHTWDLRMQRIMDAFQSRLDFSKSER